MNIKGVISQQGAITLLETYVEIVWDGVEVRRVNTLHWLSSTVLNPSLEYCIASTSSTSGNEAISLVMVGLNPSGSGPRLSPVPTNPK